MIVAIDGPAGVGKSTIAKKCAAETGFLYINSGNLYRAVTYLHLSSGGNPDDSALLVERATEARIEFSGTRIIVNGIDVTDKLHTDHVDSWVAQHSALVPVRRIVNALLRSATEGLDVVVEGRDITTVVFPDAEVKIYLDASIEERARRRHEQGTSNLTLEELREKIAERDRIDTHKEVGSLEIASDACYIDTSRLTIEQVCERVSQLIRNTKFENFA